MPDFPWPTPGWPTKGDKVKFLNANGYPRELENAQQQFHEGQILTVKHCTIGGWSSTYEFDELPGKLFNTVMFEWPLKADKPEPTVIAPPTPRSKWRHADGGLYEVLEVRGQIRQTGSNAWEPVVVYDHADGTQSFGPYYTGLERFLERFEPA